MGVQSGEGSDIIIRHFLPTLIFSQLKILSAYLLLGAIFGVLTFVFWSVVLSERYIGAKLRCKLFVTLVSLLLLETFFLAKNVLKYPALYSEFFYERGGIRRSFELFITNNLAPKTFNTVCYTPLSTFSATSDPNVIIIGADSLRRDYITKEISPNIYNIAQNGANFTNCFVSLPRTLPQWITFFKSQYPAEHGVRNMFPDKSLREHETNSLPGILRRNGYTNAVVSDFAGDVFSRLNIGFDIVKTPYFNFNTLIEQRGLEIHYLLLPYITNYWGRKVFPVLKEFANNADPFLLEKEAEETILKVKGSKFFLTIFFSTAHFPYASCYPYYNYYMSKDYQGAYRYYKPNIPGEPIALPEEDLAQIRTLYKQSVTCIDDAVGRLRLFLKEHNLDKNTIIVVLADHGEQLYENEWGQGHGEHLRGRSVLNIPFIIYDPREKFKNNCIDELVRDIDLTPTLLNILSLRVPKTMEGVNLLPLMRKQIEVLNLTTYAETGLWFTDKGDNFYQKQRIMYPDIVELGTIDTEYNNEVIIKPEYRDLTNIAKHRMVYDGRYKLIYIPTREGISFELYDTRNDPDELENIVDKNPRKVVELKTKLQRWMEKGLWRNGYFVSP